MPPLSWRKWNRSLHRDLGYLCVGLTLVYAVTGILLNHVHSWNPANRVERRSFSVEPFPDPPSFSGADIRPLLDRIGEPGTPTGNFRPDPLTVQLFFEDGRRISVDLATGRGEGELVKPRPIIAALNALHLNKASRSWTILADLYAAALAVLALTGLVLLRGSNGLAGRGGWLTALGIATPTLFLILSML